MAFNMDTFGGENSDKTGTVENGIKTTYEKYNSELASLKDLEVHVQKDMSTAAYFEDSRGQREKLKIEHSKKVLQGVLDEIEGKSQIEIMLIANQFDRYGLTFALQHLLVNTGALLRVDGDYGDITKTAIKALPVSGEKFSLNGLPSKEVIEYLVGFEKYEGQVDTPKVIPVPQTSTDTNPAPTLVPETQEKPEQKVGEGQTIIQESPELLGDAKLHFLAYLDASMFDNSGDKTLTFSSLDNTEELKINGVSFPRVRVGDNFTGFGFTKTSLGEVFLGDFKNGAYSGVGLKIKPDGTSEYGIWEKGERLVPGKQNLQKIVSSIKTEEPITTPVQTVNQPDTKTSVTVPVTDVKQPEKASPVTKTEPETVQPENTASVVDDNTGTTDAVTEELVFNEKMSRSEKQIGKNEMTFLLSYFSLNTVDDFTRFVEKVQQNFSADDQDGIVGPQTLEAIYEQYYRKDINKLPTHMQARLYAADVIQNYSLDSVNKRKLPLSGVRNPYEKGYFYGESLGENLPGTFISKELAKLNLPQTSDYNNGNSIQVQKIEGKVVSLMYVKGKLEVATYSSPGKENEIGKDGVKKLQTPENVSYKVGDLNANYISGSYPEKNADGTRGGAIMPFAYRISGGYFGHVGTTTGENESHGCLRSPLLYQYAIFQNLKSNPGVDFKIKIGDIY